MDQESLFKVACTALYIKAIKLLYILIKGRRFADVSSEFDPLLPLLFPVDPQDLWVTVTSENPDNHDG